MKEMRNGDGMESCTARHCQNMHQRVKSVSARRNASSVLAAAVTNLDTILSSFRSLAFPFVWQTMPLQLLEAPISPLYAVSKQRYCINGKHHDFLLLLQILKIFSTITTEHLRSWGKEKRILNFTQINPLTTESSFKAVGGQPKCWAAFPWLPTGRRTLVQKTNTASTLSLPNSI